jgi:hypothetical protein
LNTASTITTLRHYVHKVAHIGLVGDTYTIPQAGPMPIPTGPYRYRSNSGMFAPDPSDPFYPWARRPGNSRGTVGDLNMSAGAKVRLGT